MSKRYHGEADFQWTKTAECPTIGLERVAFVLEHFREGKALAILDGRSAALVRDLMAEMIGGDAKTAYAIAGAQLALIGAWLTGKDTRSAEELARTLSSVTAALRSLDRASA